MPTESFDPPASAVQGLLPPDNVTNILENIAFDEKNENNEREFTGPKLVLSGRGLTSEHCHLLQEFFLRLHIYGLVKDYSARKYVFNSEDQIGSTPHLSHAAQVIGAPPQSIHPELGNTAYDDVSICSGNVNYGGCPLPLSVVDLSDNNINAYGLRMFLHSACVANRNPKFYSPKEMELILSQNKLEGKEVGQLLARLLKNPDSRIASLVLDANYKFGDTNAALLAKALVYQQQHAACIKLQKLSLRGAGITDVGASALCDALLTNHSIKSLELEGNQVSEHLLGEIEYLLKRNQGKIIQSVITTQKLNNPYSKYGTLSTSELASAGAISMEVTGEQFWKLEKEMLEVNLRRLTRQKQVLTDLEAKLMREVEQYKEREAALKQYIYKDVNKAIARVDPFLSTIEATKAVSSQPAPPPSSSASASSSSLLLVEDSTALKPKNPVVVQIVQGLEEPSKDLSLAYAPHCYAVTGQFLKPKKIGFTHKFKVQTVNYKKIPLAYGGEDLTFKLYKLKEEIKLQQNLESWNITVEDQCDGSYVVSYIPTKDGEFELHISIRGEEIQESPFKVVVLPEPSPDFCSITGLAPSLVYASPVIFDVNLRDRMGNPIQSPMEYKLDIALKKYVSFDPSTKSFITECQYPDGLQAKNNSISAYIIPRSSGLYSLEVTYAGEHVSGSPCPITVRQEAYAPYCRCVGNGVEPIRLFARKPTPDEYSFTIVACDANSHCIRSGGDQFAVKIHNRDTKEDIPVTITDNLDGTYTAKYNLKKEGAFVIDVGLFKNELLTPVYGSPFTIFRPEDVVTSKSTLEVISTFYKNCNNRIAIVPRSREGLPVNSKTRQTFKITITNPAKKSAIIYTDKIADVDSTGKNWIKLKLTNSGEYVVRATYDNEDIEGSPCTIQVRDDEAAPCMLTSILRGPGLGMALQANVDADILASANSYIDTASAGQVVVNKPTRFMVLLKDKKAKPLTQSGDDVRVFIATAAGDELKNVKVTSVKNGNYLVEYIPRFPTLYFVSVFVNHEPMRNRPFCVRAGHQPAPHQSLIKILSTFEIQVLGRNSSILEGEAYNPDGNVFTANFSGAGTVDFEANYIGNAKYQVRVKNVSQRGQYMVTFSLNGTKIQDCPFQVNL